MNLYYQVNEPNSHYESFVGMDTTTVTNMLTARGKTYTTKTQTDWETVEPPGNAIYVFAGQSNAVNLAAQEGDNLAIAMGTSNAIHVDTGVGGTAMSRWVVGAGDLYEAMITSIASAKAGKPLPWVDGLIFWQGESDFTQQNIDLWAGRFTTLVSSFRTAMNDPNRRVVFVQITNNGNEGRTAMRAVQASISIPNVVMVPTEGITYVGDHTDVAGYTIMATRIVAALKSMP